MCVYVCIYIYIYIYTFIPIRFRILDASKTKSASEIVGLSCTGFTIISTTYISKTARQQVIARLTHVVVVCLFVSSEILKGRSLELLIDPSGW